MECAYHSRRWSSNTQQLINVLRKSLSLRPDCVHRFAKVVCSCSSDENEDAARAVEKILEEASQLKQWLYEHSPPHDIGRVLELYITAAQDRPSTAGGLLQLITVVKEATEGNFHQLDPPKTSSPTLNPKVEECWELDLPPKYLGVLVGAKAQHIQPLCEECSVQVFFGSKQTRKKGGYYRQSLHESSIKVMTRGEEGVANFDQFKARLIKRSKIVFVKRQEHEENVRKFAEKRRKFYQLKMIRQTNYFNSRSNHGEYNNSKEAAEDHFERKQQQKHKSRHPSRSGPHAAISDGHCLHCLTPYTPNQTHDGACTHHPGYLVQAKPKKGRGFRWTCCNRRNNTKQPSQEMHTKTGCCTGRHTWRAGKSVSKKQRSFAGSKNYSAKLDLSSIALSEDV